MSTLLHRKFVHYAGIMPDALTLFRPLFLFPMCLTAFEISDEGASWLFGEWVECENLFGIEVGCYSVFKALCL